MMNLKYCYLRVNQDKKLAIHYDRETALICEIDGKEVFSIEMDGTIKGSINRALEICKEAKKNNSEEQVILGTTIGLLEAIRNLTHWSKR